MFTKGNNNNSSFTTDGDMITIHNASIMDSFPMYSFKHEMRLIKRFDNKMCKEFDGDCLKFVQKHFIMFFEQKKVLANKTKTKNKFELRECSKSEMNGMNKLIENYLWLCGPYEKLTL